MMKTLSQWLRTEWRRIQALGFILSGLGRAVMATRSYALIPLLIVLLSLALIAAALALAGPLAPFVYPVL